MPTVQLTTETLEYQIVRTRRRTVGVVVREDGTLEVRAPRRASVAEIRDVVAGFSEWIERQRALQRHADSTRPRVRWRDGDTIPFLGEPLTIRVRTERGLFPGAVWRTDDGKLVVFVPPGTPDEQRAESVRAAVLGWLIEQATEVFHQSHVRASAAVGLSAERIRIKEMRTRWGSCGPKRRMSLNWRLVLAPIEVIDYVLVHELVHIEVPNHSRRFWSRVEAACPDYRKHRRWLRDNASRLDLSA